MNMTAQPQPLWSAQAVLEATGGSGPAHWSAQGVSIDSRSLQPKDLFVALQGDARDGHDFLDQAFAAGASAALIKRHPRQDHQAAIYVRVADPLQALRRLAAHARARSKAKIIAVTGSVGKTGIKDALGHVLASALSVPVHVSARSYNNHWGVPLSLARLPAHAPYGIFEVGMNHAGEITPLTRLLAPDVALVSAVRPAHTEFFSSLEEVADAKAEIFAGLRQDGIAVLGRDDPWFERLQAAALRAGARLVTFGQSTQADVRLLQAHRHGETSDVEVDMGGEKLAFEIGVPGAHWIANSLAVLACCCGLGVSGSAVAPMFASLQPPPGRGQRRRVPWGAGELLLIDESYNANPASMQAAIATLGDCSLAPGGRRIAALGDMLELGSESRRWHVSLADAITAAQIDLLFTCGMEMRHLFDAVPSAVQGAHCADAQSLADCLETRLQAGDALMVKGSNGMGMQVILQHLAHRAAAAAGPAEAGG